MAAPLARVKLRTNVILPAQVNGGLSIAVTKANGIYTFDFDPADMVQLPSVTDDQFPFTFMLSYNIDTASMALLPFNVAVTDKLIVEKTDAGDINVGVNDGLIIINKTVPQATNIYLPPSGTKSGAVKIVDFAGNSGTYNITIHPDGSEKLNGQSTWTLAGDGASVVLDPVGTQGYAV